MNLQEELIFWKAQAKKWNCRTALFALLSLLITIALMILYYLTMFRSYPFTFWIGVWVIACPITLLINYKTINFCYYFLFCKKELNTLSKKWKLAHQAIYAFKVQATYQLPYNPFYAKYLMSANYAALMHKTLVEFEYQKLVSKSKIKAINNKTTETLLSVVEAAIKLSQSRSWRLVLWEVNIGFSLAVVASIILALSLAPHPLALISLLGFYAIPISVVIARKWQERLIANQLIIELKINKIDLIELLNVIQVRRAKSGVWYQVKSFEFSIWGVPNIRRWRHSHKNLLLSQRTHLLGSLNALNELRNMIQNDPMQFQKLSNNEDLPKKFKKF